MEDRRPSVLKPAIDPALEMSDSDLFWQDNWRKFAWGLALLVLAILLVGAWFLYQGHVRNSSESLYSAASGPEGATRRRTIRRNEPSADRAGAAPSARRPVLRT